MRTEISCGPKGEKLAWFWFSVRIQTVKTWPIDPLGLRNVQVEVSLSLSLSLNVLMCLLLPQPFTPTHERFHKGGASPSPLPPPSLAWRRLFTPWGNTYFKLFLKNQRNWNSLEALPTSLDLVPTPLRLLRTISVAFHVGKNLDPPPDPTPPQ